MAIRYPAALQDTGVPYVTFSFFSSGDRTPGGEIILFMPPAFQITDSQDYEFENEGIGGQIFTALDDGMYGAASAAWDAITRKVLTLSGDAAQAAASQGQAVRDPKFFNYKEPKPREFTFTYKFEPKNPADASAMIAAIRTFRVASYPEALPGGRMYKVPDSVTMTFKNIKTTLGLRDPAKIENLVIKEINTTLSEGEQMTTFEDGTPTQVSLQIQFAESSLLTKTTL
jgi:Tail-tube assembly protein